jgi:hypothetical protein
LRPARCRERLGRHAAIPVIVRRSRLVFPRRPQGRRPGGREMPIRRFFSAFVDGA